ncbi:MAG: phosphate acetyltransferase [Microcoleaceae cyanobacterium]
MVLNLYVTAIEPWSGRSLVLLGVMEILSKRIGKLGFFRPVIHSGEKDTVIQLIQSRYPTAVPYEAQYALTHEQVQHLVAEGKQDELSQIILEKYKALEEQCDFVLCAGTSSEDITATFEFDFNARIANQLGTPILLVVSGQTKTPEELIDAVRASHESLTEEGCTITATLVNRVSSTEIELIRQEFAQIWREEDPIFVIPEEPSLWKPTIQEVTQALNARLIHGNTEGLSREVYDFKVAAMQLHHFLDYIEEGSLVMTPGDRTDILLTCLTAFLSDAYPNLAGIVLTGGLKLEPNVQKLVDGFTQWTLPIFTVEADTFSAASQASRVQAQITAETPRKIAAALGLFETHVDADRLSNRISISRSNRITPLMFEYALVERAKQDKKHIVLPEGTEERILRASEVLLQRDVVDLTLLGSRTEIRQKIATLGLDLKGVNIIDPANYEWHDEYAQTYYELRKHKAINLDYANDVMHDVSYFGTMMVYKGVADGMVSGSVHTTAHTIRPAFEFVRTRPGCSIVSSVFFMCLSDRILVYGDCAVNPNPNPQQLADIAISSAETAKTFSVEPLVAMLSYSTGESGRGEDVDKVREATQIARTQRPDLKIEGPIQYDAAIDESVAKTKLPDSEVAGHATVFIFPDLNTGNNTYKAVQRAANAVAIGPVLQGLKKPVNDLSRGCTIPDIVNTVAITAIQAQTVG